ncbi:MAG: AAA family ATPase [Enterococcus gallinarum]|nr:AAA family ATPase [Enterococcus gallinarum]
MKIKIYNLFDMYNVSLDLENKYHMKIFLGENGIGKTTILNIINSILTGNVQRVIDIPFSRIHLEIEKEKFEFSKLDMISLLKLDEAFSVYRMPLRRNMSEEDFSKLRVMAKDNDLISFLSKLEELYVQGSIPTGLINRIKKTIFDSDDFVDDENDYEQNDWMRLLNYLKLSKVRIMYFPTYRRIEEDLVNLIEEDMVRKGRPNEYIDYEIENPSIKMLKSGMKDVEKILKSIEKIIEKNSIDSFNRVTGDMMTYLLKDGFKYIQNQDLESDVDKIEVILNRITHEHLDSGIKQEVLEKLHTSKISNEGSLNFFIGKLLEYYKQEEEIELQVIKFVKICNKYLVNKQFIYDQAAMKIYIINNVNKKTITLGSLSSGEKQIISIFALIYLDQLQEKIFIMLDEPELSLSVIWQESLIQDIYDSGKVSYILAVTHSPFIYSNLDDSVSENMESCFELILGE